MPTKKEESIGGSDHSYNLFSEQNPSHKIDDQTGVVFPGGYVTSSVREDIEIAYSKGKNAPLNILYILNQF